MSQRVLIIGSGQRVRRAALPALLARADSFSIAGVWSRQPKQICAEDKTGKSSSAAFEVQALAGLTGSDLAGVDLVYLCVSKPAVPKLLAQLADLLGGSNGRRPNLLIDTPVLLFKHMNAMGHFAAFDRVWVAEDMSTLPWLDSLQLVRADLGTPQQLLLDRSAFAYHGVALAKTLLGNQQLTRARRKSTGPGQNFERNLWFTGGQRCQIYEPRDYTKGGFRLTCSGGSIADPGSKALTPGDLHLVCRMEGERCLGFDAIKSGAVQAAYSTDLPEHEVELLGNFPGSPQGTGPIQYMDAMKRVGFARLLDRIAGGSSLWSLEDGLDDMWIDYLTEKTGRWRRTPLTSARSALARRVASWAMSVLSR